jgi:hypothetical protein
VSGCVQSTQCIPAGKPSLCTPSASYSGLDSPLGMNLNVDAKPTILGRDSGLYLEGETGTGFQNGYLYVSRVEVSSAA